MEELYPNSQKHAAPEASASKPEFCMILHDFVLGLVHSDARVFLFECRARQFGSDCFDLTMWMVVPEEIFEHPH